MNVTADVKNGVGKPVSGVTVDITVKGANPASGIGVSDANGNFNHDDGKPSDTKNVTWMPPQKTSFTLAASNAKLDIGTAKTVTATVKDDSAKAVRGATVNFKVTGANEADSTRATDKDGKASFTYIGTDTGTDTVNAHVDANFNDNQDVGEPSSSVTITWPGSSSSPSPSPSVSPSPSPSPAPSSFWPVQPSQACDGCTFFSEIQHNLCGGFRDYWNNYGSLAVYGYPASEEFTERNPDNGQVYTVQYFERARFEWRPGAWAERSDMMLRRLGAQVLEIEHGVKS
jgi:hypothetical protein